MKKGLFIFVLSLLISSSAWAESLVAKVNRNPVPSGEMVILTLEYDGGSSDNPDTRALEKDFMVYSTSSSSVFKNVNGQSSRSRQWSIGLSPKAEGEVTIPAFKLGNAESQPIVLKVVDNLAAGEVSASGPRFSIAAKIDNPRPFVQQQINYTLTIRTSEVLQGGEPQFLGTGNNDWIIRSLGKPVVTKEIVNGTQIEVIELEYALFPQKSGKLTIPEVLFEGSYVDNTQPRRDPLRMATGDFLNVGFNMDFLAARSPVRLTAKAIDVTVSRIPPENGGNWWLPVRSAELFDYWSNYIPEFKTGEAVSRQITLTVVGAIDSQLPKIDFKDVAGIKQYPEKPILSTRIINDKVVSTMDITNVYIPERSGELELPEIAVNWFNVSTGKMERTAIPALKIKVAKGLMPEPKTYTEEERKEIEVEIAKISDDVNLIYIYLMIGLAFVFGVLFSYLMFRPKKTIEKETKEEAPDISKAFRSKDLKAMRDSVIAWAKQNYASAEISNLDDVANVADDKVFSEQLKLLSKALYAPDKSQFDAVKFKQVFDRASKKQKKSRKKDKLLPDLY